MKSQGPGEQSPAYHAGNGQDQRQAREHRGAPGPPSYRQGGQGRPEGDSGEQSGREGDRGEGQVRGVRTSLGPTWRPNATTNIASG